MSSWFKAPRNKFESNDFFVNLRLILNFRPTRSDDWANPPDISTRKTRVLGQVPSDNLLLDWGQLLGAYIQIFWLHKSFKVWGSLESGSSCHLGKGRQGDIRIKANSILSYPILSYITLSYLIWVREVKVMLANSPNIILHLFFSRFWQKERRALCRKWKGASTRFRFFFCGSWLYEERFGSPEICFR